MIKQISSILSSSFNPYENLALEKYLFDHVKDDEIILYLWQNERTVVCGRNQNLWKECHVSRLLEDGGYPVRRLSGGGAVFHDKGNLNFTFLMKKDNYDVDRQLQVILQACRDLGIHAEKTGRNDITVDGRKFSGNAFYSSGGRKYHHGTLLIQVDTSMMSAYLNVDKEKLATKGVSSVRSRVANLIEFRPDLTIQIMKDAMFQAFETVYQLPVSPYQFQISSSSELEETRQFFCSDAWLYGRKIDFAYRINRRFQWGMVRWPLIYSFREDSGESTTSKFSLVNRSYQKGRFSYIFSPKGMPIRPREPSPFPLPSMASRRWYL